MSKKFAPEKEPAVAMYKDLLRSGITQQEAKWLKLTPLDDVQAETVLNTTFAMQGYVFPYFDINGKPTNFFRVRFTKELKGENNKIVRYSQLKGSTPHVYFPLNVKTKWKVIAKDINQPIIITEGEKKSFVACKHGLNCMGLGGVWSFKSAKLGKELLDEFLLIDWKDRKVLICFDNDSHTNPDVRAAMNQLAVQLTTLGAKVAEKTLPEDPYNKIGLDDYLIKHTVKDFLALPENNFDEVLSLNKFNEELAYIKSLGKFYIIPHNVFVSAANLRTDTYSHRTITSHDGKKISLVDKWIRWEGRREHTQLTYKPGQAQVTEDNELNLWRGWGAVPKKGDVSLFLDVVDKVFSGEKKLIQWFLDWVAYPIQNPGTKMLTGVLFQSIAQGTGKSSIGLCIGAMYGENFSIIGDTILHSNYNDWQVGKQFILGDEISGKDKRQDSDRIKNMITQPQIIVNKKYTPMYSIPDTINYLFTSNHVDALNLEYDDRRIFVHSLRPDNYIDLKLGKELEIYHKSKTHLPYLLHYFMYEHQISKNFSHSARPPMTESKLDMIDHSHTDIERYLVAVRQDPDVLLRIDKAPIDRDLFTVAQVLSLYKRTHQLANVTGTAMGKAIAKVFYDSPRMIVRTKSGVQKLIALRNITKWGKLLDSKDAKAWAEHFDNSSNIVDLGARKRRKHKVESKD